MKRGVIIILVGVLLIVITGIVYVVFQMDLFGGEVEEEPLQEAIDSLDLLQATETPVPEFTEIVVAVWILLWIRIW